MYMYIMYCICRAFRKRLASVLIEDIKIDETHTFKLSMVRLRLDTSFFKLCTFVFSRVLGLCKLWLFLTLREQSWQL